jgi:GNAT superfamily N-acetyltransferase
MSRPRHISASRDGFLISTDPALIDLDVVHGFLSTSYWSPGIPRDIVRRGIDNALTFGVYDQRTSPHGQVGFARVITDKATFAYLSDVFILDSHRGHGLSKWLVEIILAHPDLQNLRRFCLLTRDAHGLYERFGFGPIPDPRNYMERRDPDVYKRLNQARSR